MPDISLVLGPVLFREFEIPSRINFGGRQHVVVHSLPGGARVIDVLGRDDAQIKFTGIFSGIDATLRARSLNELRSAGLPLPLTWDVFYYTVVITELKIDYRSGWWIPFNIVCTVLQDQASILPNLPLSLTSLIGSDVNAAVTYASNAALDLSALQSALVGSNATFPDTERSATTQALLATTQAAISAAINTANDLIQSLDISYGSSAQDGVTNLLGATDAIGQLSSLVTASSYVNRLATNLANAST